MMQPFLESLAIHLIASAGSELGDIRIILPNRRAGLFLQRHLAAHASKTTWLPRIYTISDFIDEMSSLELADPLDIFFKLYDIYEGSTEKTDSMDEFYLWGEMMLRDFDEIDKYRVDAAMLFRNISDLKELEEPLAGLEPEQLQAAMECLDETMGIVPEGDVLLQSWKLPSGGNDHDPQADQEHRAGYRGFCNPSR